MAGRQWTTQEIAILRKMAMAGKTAREISVVLVGRTVMAIESKASEMGLSLAGPGPKINFQAYREIMKAEREVKCL
jgi:hypothetical protein